MIQKQHKKAITAVVVTALLIVVAVATVIGFQSWFGSFSSKTFVNVEQNSDQTDSSSQIETLVGDELYFKNNLEENLSIKEIKVNGKVCNISITNISLGMESISLQNCTDNLTTNIADVVIMTDKQIFNKKIFLKDVDVVEAVAGVTDLPNCIPVNNILHVGAGQTYSNFSEAYIASNDGDAVVIHSGIHNISSLMTFDKNIKVFGSTGNPNDVIINSYSSTYAFYIRMDLMSELNVSPGFYHFSFIRQTSGAWSGVFLLWGKNNPDNATMTFENLRMNALPSFNGDMYPISVRDFNPKIIINNIDYLSTPYANVFGWSGHQATLIVSSFYSPSSRRYYDHSFTILKDDTCTNSANCGTSKYNQSNAVFPCGYRP